MIVVNLWFINQSNGLFHYGLDYAETLGSDVIEIWIRNPELAYSVRKRLPRAHIRVLSVRALLISLRDLRQRGDLLFTPSSHPTPFIPRQVVVVHDGFPFTGRVGAIKLALFRSALVLSRAKAAYINYADSYHLLRRCGLPEARMHYLPNRLPPSVPDQPTASLVVGSRLVVGLFGSDSAKKNYDAIFASFTSRRTTAAVIWRIYGHINYYTDRLIAEYPSLRIEIVGSDVQTMEEFISAIDVAVSVAPGEGFARPIAQALMRGVPSLLLDTPVFREFYAGSAHLFTSIEALAAAIAALRPGDQLERLHLEAEGKLRADFNRAVTWLKSC